MKSCNILFSMLFITILMTTVMSLPLPAGDGALSGSETFAPSDTISEYIAEPSNAAVEEAAPVVPASGTIVIIVESTLYSSISAAVAQYRTDLNNTGYHTILYTDLLSTAEELKGNLTMWYATESILGAVLIGRLPYAQFYHPANGGFNAETFICDLFLMDLDGNWTDVNPIDGIYDTHAAIGNADIYPEIFVSRIDPTCLSWGTSVADHINTYLARVHDYRTGGVQRSKRALVYIDDDWIPWSSQWSSDIGYAYSTRTNVFLSAFTNATDWATNRLLQDYQWGHLCAHSSATTHYFGPGGSGQGTVSSAQIRAAPPSFNFYNLFCCSGAKWTVTDNLGVTYVFSGPNSLAAIGSSKTGSMMDNDRFYEPLGQNATLGAGLVEWFQHALRSDSEAGTTYLEWYYGLNIIGDPFLGIHYDTTVFAPTVTSATHPVEHVWYESATPVLNWTEPIDVNTITGYYYILDQNPATVPTAASGTFTANTSLVVGDELPSGQWYFHIVAADSAGNIGSSPTHYRIQIDTAGPALVIQSPTPLQNITASAFDFTWTAEDAYSGYAYSNLQIDDIEVYNGTGLTHSLDSLLEGLHTMNLTAYDVLGNMASITRSFRVDLTDPNITQFGVEGPFTLGSNVLAEWTVYDGGSGYCFAELYLNGEFLVQTNISQTTFLLEELEVGNHTLVVIAFDYAGRNSSEMISFVIINPTSDWLLPVGIGVTVLLLVAIWGIRSRKR